MRAVSCTLPRDVAQASGHLVVVQPPAPACEHAMDGGRADDGRVGDSEICRMKDERPGLRAPDPTVKGDQLLERAAGLERGIVEAADHDVGDVAEAVGTAQVLRRVW